eukprot:2933712-Pleurochrysis_carterae.AAC.3
MQCALRGAVRAGGEATQNSAGACAVQAQAPEVTRSRTVAVCCARHTGRPWRGSGVHGRDRGGRCAAIHSRRVGECGLRIGVAGTSADSAVAASLVSRVPA